MVVDNNNYASQPWALPAHEYSARSPVDVETTGNTMSVSNAMPYAQPPQHASVHYTAMTINAEHMSIPSVSRSFSGWANWGGTWASDPTCLSLKNEGLDAFTVGLDGYIYYRGGHLGILHSWVKISGATAQFPPAVAVQRDGSIDVVIHGTDNILYYARRDPLGIWHSFVSLNFKSYRRPGVAPWYNRGLFIFAIGTDNKMYKLERRHSRWWYGNAAKDWVSFGGSWSGGVTGGYISGTSLTNSVYVLAYDMNGYLQYTRFHVESADSLLQNWSGKWINLQVQGTMAPALSARSDGFDVVVRTTSGQMAVNSYNLNSDSWIGWVHLGLTTVTIPAIASDASGFVYIFALDGNHQLKVCHRDHQSSSFGSWYSLGGPFSSSPSALVRENRLIDVFVLDSNRRLVHASTTF